MKIIDISWPLHESITGYKDQIPVTFEQLKQFEQDNVRDSRITIHAHAGTHIDAPSHFLCDGETIDAVKLNTVIGECQVIDCTNVAQVIKKDDLVDRLMPGVRIVLLKTKNSNHLPTDPFDYTFVYLAHDAAAYLIEKGVGTVGIDYLGIERNQSDHATHVQLMKHGITIIEGLRLRVVFSGTYFLIALPIAVVGIEAAPARAVLLCD